MRLKLTVLSYLPFPFSPPLCLPEFYGLMYDLHCLSVALFLTISLLQSGEREEHSSKFTRKTPHGQLIFRNLQRRGLVITILNDQGRQRVTNFVAKKFENISSSSNQGFGSNIFYVCSINSFDCNFMIDTE